MKDMFGIRGLVYSYCLGFYNWVFRPFRAVKKIVIQSQNVL